MIRCACDTCRPLSVVCAVCRDESRATTFADARAGARVLVERGWSLRLGDAVCPACAACDECLGRGYPCGGHQPSLEAPLRASLTIEEEP